MITYLSISTSLDQPSLPHVDRMIAAFLIIFEAFILAVVLYIVDDGAEVSAFVIAVFLFFLVVWSNFPTLFFAIVIFNCVLQPLVEFSHSLEVFLFHHLLLFSFCAALFAHLNV